MNLPKTPSEQGPGHYGAGYGEQVPADAPTRPATSTDTEAAAPARTTPVDAGKNPASGSGSTTQGDDGAPVVFTPDDVSARPPDQPPTENAAASEKAGLIFERS